MKWPTAILMGGGLALLFAFMGWSFYSTRSIGFGSGTGAIVVMIVAGALGVGLLTGVLMWLAFYSSREGYDESPRFGTKPDAGEEECALIRRWNRLPRGQALPGAPLGQARPVRPRRVRRAPPKARATRG